MLPVTVRPMTADDIPQVIPIEAECFPELSHPSPFHTELESRLARYFVAVRPTPVGDQVVGYLGLWFVLDEAHITSIGVHSDLRRQGIAWQLLLTACDVSLARECILLTLEVRASNTAAQQLYQAFGLRRVGIRKRYYSDNGEDAWLMTIEGIDQPAFRDQLGVLRRRAAEAQAAG